MNNTLLTPLHDVNKVKKNEASSHFFIIFLNRLEGWKTKCKNLHWSAPNRSIHIYLDEFLEILNTYQDGLAEGYMGILGQMEPNVIKGIPSEKIDALSFIYEVRDVTLIFYNSIPEDTVYKGITSDCETFIQAINKYIYLFKLCF